MKVWIVRAVIAVACFALMLSMCGCMTTLLATQYVEGTKEAVREEPLMPSNAPLLEDDFTLTTVAPPQLQY